MTVLRVETEMEWNWLLTPIQLWQTCRCEWRKLPPPKKKKHKNKQTNKQTNKQKQQQTNKQQQQQQTNEMKRSGMENAMAYVYLIWIW